MLLDPFEKQLDLPATLVERANGQCGQLEIVAQEDQSLSRFRIFETDSPQLRRIILKRLYSGQGNCLVADNACAAVDGGRIDAPTFEIGLGTSNEHRMRSMQGMKACEIDISTIHHVERSRFRHQDIEYIGIA